MLSTTARPIGCSDAIPAGVLEAFWAYDAALLANDRDALSDLFADGDLTIRGDGKNLLVGKQAITAFRAGRSAIPTRQVRELQVRVLAEDAVLVMAATVEPDSGATGLQTQVWQLSDAGWRVTAAHVSLPVTPPAFDRSIWRVLGDPLVHPTASGSLSGIRVAVKDLYAIAGQPVGAGVPSWLAEQEPEADHAPVVAELLAAGVSVVGIARTDEFAYSLAGTNAHYGCPPNPAVPNGISGGSTSGCASAVALFQAEVGLGTDTAGSIRVPASYQGLVGFRSSHDLIDRTGVLALAPAFDTLSWLTRDVPTSARVAEVLLHKADASISVTRTLWPADLLRLPDPDVTTAFTARTEAFIAAGLLPPAADLELSRDELETWFLAFRTVQGFQAWQQHGSWISAHPGALGSDVAARFAAAAQITAADYDHATEIVLGAKAKLVGLLADSVLVLPAASGPAIARDARDEAVESARGATLRLTCLASIAGAPAISLPLLSVAGASPVGLCLIGAPGTDRDLLALAGKLS